MRGLPNVFCNLAVQYIRMKLQQQLENPPLIHPTRKRHWKLLNIENLQKSIPLLTITNPRVLNFKYM